MNTEMEFKIGNYYKIQMNKKLGSGAFGEIYQGKPFSKLGMNIKTNEDVAIKMVLKFIKP
jgi:hypothetical protein